MTWTLFPALLLLHLGEGMGDLLGHKRREFKTRLDRLGSDGRGGGLPISED